MGTKHGLSLRGIAESNIRLLLRPNPGDGFIVGLDETGENLVVVCWIIGVDPKTRNRVFGYESGRIFTDVADSSKPVDQSLLYNVMHEFVGLDFTSGVVMVCVVGNGDQTDKVIADCSKHSFFEIMNSCTYKPDLTNTLRITAVSSWFEGEPYRQMSILRKSVWSDKCNRNLYEINDVGKGFGYCLTTFSGGGFGTQPPFGGEPYLLPLEGGINDIAEEYWEMLDSENKVALAVKFIPRDPDDVISFRIKNKLPKI